MIVDPFDYTYNPAQRIKIKDSVHNDAMNEFEGAINDIINYGRLNINKYTQ